jgi:DNA-binding PadR family transcriptional regulator
MECIHVSRFALPGTVGNNVHDVIADFERRGIMRYAFLALLAKVPAHGYELKQAFEEAFGDVWPPLNFGQIYTTLQRLERDTLIQSREVPQARRRDKKVYELTRAGHEELRSWLAAPATGPWLKDEFFMKLVMAGLTDAADQAALIERQRRVYMEALQELNSLAARYGGNPNAVPSLLIEGAALHLQADLKWLELCEATLVGSSIMVESDSS